MCISQLEMREVSFCSLHLHFVLMSFESIWRATEINTNMFQAFAQLQS